VDELDSGDDELRADEETAADEDELGSVDELVPSGEEALELGSVEEEEGEVPDVLVGEEDVGLPDVLV
jgi:hypothetical protein